MCVCVMPMRVLPAQLKRLLERLANQTAYGNHKLMNGRVIIVVQKNSNTSICSAEFFIDTSLPRGSVAGSNNSSKLPIEMLI